MYLIELASIALEYIEMPVKKAKETFGKRKDTDRFTKYIQESLFPLMISAAGSAKKEK